MLVGYEYAYDDVNNPLYEKFKHDNDYYDNYQYDDLYRLTGVVYRDGSSKDYRSVSSGWTTGNFGQFNYDDNSNRTTSTDGDPFGNVSATADTYTINGANEYTQINRDSSNTNPTYDAAGNMTSTPVRPGSGVSAGQNVALTAVYDSYNHLMRGEAGSNEEQHYRYGRSFTRRPCEAR